MGRFILAIDASLTSPLPVREALASLVEGAADEVRDNSNPRYSMYYLDPGPVGYYEFIDGEAPAIPAGHFVLTVDTGAVTSRVALREQIEMMLEDTLSQLRHGHATSDTVFDDDGAAVGSWTFT